MNPPFDAATTTETDRACRLNLGAGDSPIDGYVNLDGRRGDDLRRLDWPDESVDEVRASHVLEHFGFREVGAVLAEWVRVLRVGGTLKVAVPDFARLAAEYHGGRRASIQPFVMGGQSHDLDYHKSLWDAETLTGAMRAAGLRGIHRFEPDADDCCQYPISLNLAGTKRRALTAQDIDNLNIGAAMSTPRLGFMDNFFAAYRTLGPLGIPIQQHQGAFWGQCLERTLAGWLDDGKDWILTADYDSVWTREALEDLLALARDHPEADAIAPVQIHRTQDRPLAIMKDEAGQPIRQVKLSQFMGELTPVWGAHFGLTLIRASALRDIPHPWFRSHPDDAGEWGANRIDDDVHFWQQWADYGKTLYLANHVVIGHCEQMVLWPDESMKKTYQHPGDFQMSGPPSNAWK